MSDDKEKLPPRLVDVVRYPALPETEKGLFGKLIKFAGTGTTINPRLLLSVSALYIALFILFFVGMWDVAKGRGGPTIPCIGMVIVFVIVGLVVLSAPSRGSVIKKFLESNPDPETAEFAEQLLKYYPMAEPWKGQMLLSKFLWQRGRFAEVVRIRRRSTDVPLDPLTEYFEPQVLREWDTTFAQVESAGADVEPTVGHSPTPSRAAISAIPGMVIALLFCEFMRRNKGWSPACYVIPLVILAFQFHLFRRRAEWFIVPGGIVFRETRPFRTEAHIGLLTPDQAILSIYERGKNRWHAQLAMSDGLISKKCTRREADLLIRAWCSPLSPPSIEQLSDLR
jgi:hypothetical protein